MGAADNQSTNTKGTAAGSTKSSGSASASNSGRGGRGGRGASTAESQSNQENLGLLDVKPKPVEINVKQQEKPAEEKPKSKRGRPAGSTKKPDKKKADVDATHFILLLQTVTGIVASRPGMEVFALSREEATQIATPLASILSKNDAVGEFAGEYADHIALVVACATIFVPKFLLYQAMKPKDTQLPKAEQLQASEVKQDERTSSGNGATANRTNRNTDDVQAHVRPVGGAITELVGAIV